jgi:predicted naringenin-chalcone synthase
VAVFLNDFSLRRPRYTTEHARGLEWIVEAHTRAEAIVRSLDAQGRTAFRARFEKLLERCSCSAKEVGFRSHALPTDRIYPSSPASPHGLDIGERNALFDEIVREYFQTEYAHVPTPPNDLVHVTCTGYASPSPAQHVVQMHGWGTSTRVTHAYHMGCYAALPAIRMAAGFLRAPELRRPAPRADIVHTELCTLHLDPADHSPEQLVVQSLFSDGLIRYSVRDEGGGLRLLALEERVVADSESSMRWMLSPFGMHVTLARDLPQRIAAELRNFVGVLYARAGLDARCDVQSSLCAIHPGGPRVLDAVQDALRLDEAQLDASRAVLFEHGNMSSATLPHIWARLVTAPRGTLVMSLAFGPGLTIAGALFRRE